MKPKRIALVGCGGLGHESPPVLKPDRPETTRSAESTRTSQS